MDGAADIGLGAGGGGECQQERGEAGQQCDRIGIEGSNDWLAGHIIYDATAGTCRRRCRTRPGDPPLVPG